MSPALTRRGVIQAGAVMLGAAVLPAGLSQGAPAFDPEAFVDDLQAAGYEVTACRSVPRGGEPAGPASYFIRPLHGRGFGKGYRAVMARWSDAMDACPDHVERVVAYAFGASSAAHERFSS